MQTIMIVLLEESEDLQEDLLFVILSVLGRKRSVRIFLSFSFPAVWNSH